MSTIECPRRKAVFFLAGVVVLQAGVQETAIGNPRGAPADPAVPRIWVFYDEFARKSVDDGAARGLPDATRWPDTDASSDVRVASVRDRDSMEVLVAALGDSPVLAGTVTIVDCTGQSAKGARATDVRRSERCRPAVDAASMTPRSFAVLRMLVYDADVLTEWQANGLPETFAAVNDGRAPVPDVSEAAFDIEFRIPQESGVAAGVLRLDRFDGAISVVWVSDVADAAVRTPVAFESIPVANEDQASVAGCNAGGWWPWCCLTELSACVAANQECCPDSYCWSCYESCYNCSVNNPCHACGPCGAAPFLCGPFGRCGDNALFRAINALLYRSLCIDLRR